MARPLLGGLGRRRLSKFTGIAVATLALLPLTASAQTDPRVGLAPGYLDWSEATHNIDLLANVPRSGAFDAPPGNFGFVNSDLAFTGRFAIAGNFNGFQIYDITNPASPTLRGQFVCPGGQGDVSVFGNLLFMSVEESRGRVDCGTVGAPTDPALRFQGVRVFDISNIDNPVQVATVQTCRGSHTHSLVTDPDDPDNVYVYVSGTAGVRPVATLAGCKNTALTTEPVTDPETSLWRIEVIKVPRAAPETAAVVSNPRIFTDDLTGAFNGLQNILPGTTQHPSGTIYSPTPNTNTCHDITSFPALGIAAGACQGNGILLDISDPVNPVRLDAVSDPNFSYWHSATINNDGTKVLFTDEWGGGTAARCRTTDLPEWGADAIFDIVDGELQFASYYKLPVPQTLQENCVAHNASLMPVPGRDILVQAWYQGGLSVIDFTDSANPVEIAFFDRGPVSGTALALGGLWSTYWYNGHVFGTEIARGFDVFALLPSDQLSQNEIDAATQVQMDEFNSQMQPQLVWDPSFPVVRSRFDQVVRADGITPAKAAKVAKHIDRAELFAGGSVPRAAASQLRVAARLLDSSPGQAALAVELHRLADTLG